MKQRERDRRRRAKRKWQKMRSRENKIADAERRLTGTPHDASLIYDFTRDRFTRTGGRLRRRLPSMPGN